ncbi:hypothetical protein [uncultured Phocaeicola sp.]|jgi:hypothetical protein|uniref:hypothetical protein n=1 Tax=uncultured Phocaeicola sp. TaxID=990718 RepID=UPI0025AE2F1B|nr:hypothetical protein [uncultured Phocaeicola sp.]
MIRFILPVLIIFTIFTSCKDSESEELRQNLNKEYATSVSHKELSAGSKTQYIQMEMVINQTYVKDLDSLINTGFERQLEEFEDNELGVWSGYMNMFSWLFKSKQSWDDEMSLLSNRYFNSLDIKQDHHSLYLSYTQKIKNLRKQFIASQKLPDFHTVDLPEEEISLTRLADYTRNNIGIEVIGELLGTKLFSWFLGFIITWGLVTLIGLPTGPPGWVVSLLSLIIVIVVSTIMSIHNDNKLLNQIREQHSDMSIIDSQELLKELDSNTMMFYEQL